MGIDSLKRELIGRLSYVEEVNSLIGTGKGNVRKCWNREGHANGDKSPSLSFSPRHGGWKCHACQETGDIFTLYERVHGWKYGQTYQHLLKKYGLWSRIKDFKKAAKGGVKGRDSKYKLLTSENHKAAIIDGLAYWTTTQGRKRGLLEFMATRYGLTHETIKRWKLGFNSRDRRLWIPIWSFTSKGTGTKMAPIVNIRRHDVFRSLCRWYNTETDSWSRSRPEEISLARLALQKTAPWVPKWTGKTGKVLNVKGHAVPYLYPYENIDNPLVYLVGGELKALLLSQIGIPAVTYTAGEGTFNEDFLPHFNMRRVRILFDADPGAPRDKEGFTAIDRKAFQLGHFLVSSGAEVEVGVWPESIRKFLPPNGDLTDFLIAGGLNPDLLEMLEWRRIERKPDAQLLLDEVKKSKGEPIPAMSKMKRVKFNELVDPKNLGKWVSTKAHISGRDTSPFVVPIGASISCTSGEQAPIPKCHSCRLPRCGFRYHLTYKVTEQAEMVGNPMSGVERKIKMDAGIPKTCGLPEIKVEPGAVELVTLAPTVELEDEASFDFNQRTAFFISDGLLDIKDNNTYRIGGKVLSHPKSGIFTIAVPKWERSDSDVHIFKRSKDSIEALDAALDCEVGVMDPDEQVRRCLVEFRDHVIEDIFGQDDMLLACWLSMFMPFHFRLGAQRNNRICSQMLVLGDTNTGKSTIAKAMMRHYKVGRLVQCDAKVTFPGLIGGNFTSGFKNTFSWGTIPTADRAWIAFDEYAQLKYEVIAGLTSTISGGIAERRTNAGTKRTPCRVRMLALTNPRGKRRITSYSNPLDAAWRVVGTPQDLGRFDLVHVQLPMQDINVFGKLHKKKSATKKYTSDLARFHLSWAWTRKSEDIVFENPDYITRRALELSKEFGLHVLLLPAQARFKLARLAAAFAILLFSRTETGLRVNVTNQHVVLAIEFIRSRYKQYIGSHSSAGSTMPEQLVNWLDKNINDENLDRLHFMIHADYFSMDDAREIMGRSNERSFIVLVYKLGLVNRKKNNYYWRDPDIAKTYFEEYITGREQGMALRSLGG